MGEYDSVIEKMVVSSVPQKEFQEAIHYVFTHSRHDRYATVLDYLITQNTYLESELRKVKIEMQMLFKELEDLRELIQNPEDGDDNS